MSAVGFVYLSMGLAFVAWCAVGLARALADKARESERGRGALFFLLGPLPMLCGLALCAWALLRGVLH